MKEQLRGFSKIFSFTFRQHAKSKGYKNSTIIIALLCLLVPAAIMIGLEAKDSDKAAEPLPETQEQVTADLSAIQKIYLVDTSEDKKADMQTLPLVFEYSGIEAEIEDYGDDFEQAKRDSAQSSGTLLIVTQQQGSEYTMNIVIPEGSDISEDTAQGFNGVMMAYADMLSVAQGGEAQYYGDMSEEDADPMESMKQVVMMVFTFLNLMVLYFFVLVYGQGVANSVVMEKSSKLMESILVAVKPAAVIMGKLLAITLTGIVQLFSWILALAASFAIGAAVVTSMNPETDMMIIQAFRMIGQMTEGMFSPANCIIAILMIMAGMLLYCALAGVGGAMANKAEDLSSANAIFTMVLVISFLVALYAGGVMDGNVESSILDWIPFTSVMVTPSKVLLGFMPLWKTMASFAITVATTVLVTLGAGRVYKALVLYKGEVLKISKVFKMLKN